MATVLVTGASSGFGALTARALARAGHSVFAGMRATTGRNAAAVSELAAEAGADGLDLHAVELDVADDRSTAAAVEHVLAERQGIDAVVHNAGHMVLGPAEAFSPRQVADVYDVNVIGAQRVNRAVLPHMRAQRAGLLVWVGSSSTRGGCPPFLAPYFAAKAALDALAVSYASELIRFGIDTSIVVPGAFAAGTNHFTNAGRPEDPTIEAAYGHSYAGVIEEVGARLADLSPPDADVAAVAEAIVEIVGRPAGERPFRVHVDPIRDGSEVVSAVADRMRVEFFRRIGLDDLLTPSSAL